MTLWAPFAFIASEISRRNDNAGGMSNDDEGETPQAGVVLGIHNVAIAAPQVIATLVSSAIFRALQKPRGSVGDESVAWVLRFGGCVLSLLRG
jgi:solute carrier family 45 protein 1/2/4